MISLIELSSHFQSTLTKLGELVNAQLPQVKCHVGHETTRHSLNSYLSCMLKSGIYSIDLVVQLESEQDQIIVSADLMYCENPIISEMNPVSIPLDLREDRLPDFIQVVEAYILSQEKPIVNELKKDLQSDVNYPEDPSELA